MPSVVVAAAPPSQVTSGLPFPEPVQLHIQADGSTVAVRRRVAGATRAMTVTMPSNWPAAVSATRALTPSSTLLAHDKATVCTASIEAPENATAASSLMEHVALRHAVARADAGVVEFGALTLVGHVGETYNLRFECAIGTRKLPEQPLPVAVRFAGCTGGQPSATRVTCEVCAQGSYAPPDNTGDCIECPPVGVVCEAGAAVVLPGFFRAAGAEGGTVAIDTAAEFHKYVVHVCELCWLLELTLPCCLAGAGMTMRASQTQRQASLHAQQATLVGCSACGSGWGYAVAHSSGSASAGRCLVWCVQHHGWLRQARSQLCQVLASLGQCRGCGRHADRCLPCSHSHCRLP